MKLKQLSCFCFAALYGAGMGIAQEQQGQSDQPHPQLRGLDFDKIQLQSNQAKFNQAQPKLSNQFASNQQPTGAAQQKGLNVHRAPQGNQVSQAPFEWETDVHGIQTYIVQLADAPAALYQGGVQNIPATSARANDRQTLSQSTQMQAFGQGVHQPQRSKLQLNSVAFQQYRSYLSQQQDQTLMQIRALAPQAQINKRFQVALNAMSMPLTQEQAAKVAKMPNVRAVTRSKTYQLFTDAGPDHIDAEKIWSGAAVPANVPMRGEGIVAGIIDTGINTDHPSFAAVADDGYVHINPLGEGNYVGDCVESPDLCNDKLIGVRSYEIITDSYKDPVFQPDLNPWDIADYKRPPNGEDYNGHGSHTAATVAGNLLYNVPYVLPEVGETGDGFATPLTFDEVSGVAPRANIISYQVCFAGGSADPYSGCPGEALVAAIEDAIVDGVDVINFSIGGLESLPWYDAVEMAFLAARESGISVAASAGNFGGFGNGLIDHVSPWLTNVAASTHGRKIDAIDGMLDCFEGEGAPIEPITGKGVTGSFEGRLVNAADYGDELCLAPFAEGTFTADDIVLCKRGDIARVDKGVNVAAGGAGAVILYNAVSWDDGTGGHTLNLNPFPIPGLHIDANSGQTLVNWVGSTDGDVRGKITPSELITTERDADILAGFSSRGPSSTNPNVMVPNVSAPGVDVFAAYADDMPFTQFPAPVDYTAISGTSMSSPHVAGALALLTQAHPDWTPAMLQSALMTTAEQGQTTDFSTYPASLRETTYAEMGSGVINLERAVKAPLLLDENGLNYRAANPDQGGDVSALNLPYLYKAECAGTCTWMRTFTAVEAGEWNLSAEALAMEGAPFMALDVYPKNFSLAAGQTQTIMVTANLLEAQSVYDSSANHDIFGRVDLVPVNRDQPIQYLPVMASMAGSDLPKIVTGVIHRDRGSMLTPEISSKAIHEFNPSVSGLVKGVQTTHNLVSMSEEYYNFNDYSTLVNNPGVDIHFFDVPEGTKRLVWELVSEPVSAESQLSIGIDLNRDEQIDWDEEAICYSFSDIPDFCTINDPMPGRYWVTVSNHKDIWGDIENTPDTLVTSLAVIGNTDTSSLTVSGVDSVEVNTPYQLQLDWQLADAEEGERYYGMVDIGSAAVNEGDVGSMAVHLIHDGDDLHGEVSKPQAGVGDVVDYQISLDPNLLSLERDVELSVQLPEGLRLEEDSLAVTGNHQDLLEALVVDGQNLTLNTMQAASNSIERHYSYTTSDDDLTCRIPIGSNPYYLDLFEEAQLTPAPIFGYTNDSFSLKLSDLGLGHIPLYNNDPRFMEQDTLSVSPGGFIHLDTMPLFWSAHYPMESPFFPDSVIAPLWRGDGYFDEPAFNPEEEDYDGVTLASTNDGSHLIVEWENMKQTRAFFINDNPDPEARYSFEVIASTKIDFNQGEHEFIFAYDKITGEKAHLGSIGTHGYHGPRGTFGPAYGYRGDSYAFNDLDSKINEGLVVCANYNGPEQSEIKLNFSATVLSTAVGQNLAVEISSNYTGSDELVKEVTLNVPGNLSLADIADVTMGENERESVEVFIYDRQNTSNVLSATAENVAIAVSDNMLTLIPDENWYGETEVTVTVQDAVYATDMATTRFMLTVESDGIDDAPSEGADSGGEGDDSGADGSDSGAGSDTGGSDDGSDSGAGSDTGGSDDGSDSGSDTGADEASGNTDAEATVEEETLEPNQDSGGSMGGIAVLMMMLLAIRRRLF